MAKLYFRYGAMGSSKTANALMVCYNYEERNQKDDCGFSALHRPLPDVMGFPGGSFRFRRDWIDNTVFWLTGD